MITEIVFDVETQRLFNEVTSQDPSALGVSIVSVYRRTLNESMKETNGEMLSFWEQDLPRMWPLFRDADRIIGFNSIKFDVPVLAPLAPFDLTKLPHLDIMARVKDSTGRFLGLDHLAEQTLGRRKNGKGIDAVLYWKKGDPESLSLLRSYCEHDVAITRDLYDHGLVHRKLKYVDQWNYPKDIMVDFSYPSEVLAKKRQIGLF